MARKFLRSIISSVCAALIGNTWAALLQIYEDRRDLYFSVFFFLVEYHKLKLVLSSPDYPFDEEFETAVLRHADNRKWYALVMRVSRRKFGFDSDEVVDVVNLKLPVEMFGSFGTADGVYPAYHMNKLHWISVLLPDAPEDVVRFLVNVSFEVTKNKRKRRKA